MDALALQKWKTGLCLNISRIGHGSLQESGYNASYIEKKRVNSHYRPMDEIDQRGFVQCSPNLASKARTDVLLITLTDTGTRT